MGLFGAAEVEQALAGVDGQVRGAHPCAPPGRRVGGIGRQLGLGGGQVAVAGGPLAERGARGPGEGTGGTGLPVWHREEDRPLAASYVRAAIKVSDRHKELL
ncbi:hypothetical protein ACFVWX_02095 [Streptomyces sp. NPDC058220]|uniref:hypothetical protein n=1 Tax=Streptomyces sp. NPDC058220 TaxID=3346387 RepID=UPI0036E15989